MVEQTVGFFTSFFANPSAPGIALAIAFGAIWLAAYRSPLRSRPWLWVIIVISIFLTLAAVSFIQLPLQILAGQAMGNFWSEEVIMNRILLFGIPQILLSGLVQEGAKLVPVVLYWRREGRKLDPKMGLMVGAVAGAGFGAFEAQWVHNAVFASGWTWEAWRTGGLIALVPFGERFFVVAAHAAFSALAGYGLAKGKWWQFYLIASGLHALLNYSVVLLVGGVLTGVIQIEIYVIACALSVAGWALWLRWRKTVVAIESEA